jgi:hypothetical protein
MSALSWSGNAVVQHLNVRKQGPDDEKELALDVKLCADARSEVLIHFADMLAGFLFVADGALRFPMMDPVHWNGEIRHITLTMAEHEFYDVTLRKFSFAPSAGWKVAMTFTASFAPQAKEAAIIAEMLAEAVRVEITPERDLLAGVDKETGEMTVTGSVGGKKVTAREAKDGTVNVTVAKPQAKPKDGKWPFPVKGGAAMEVD